MKKSTKKLLTLLLTLSLALNVALVAVTASGTLQEIVANLNYGITIEYNDVDQVMKDANGNRVYPISYNGTTYLPVRAVADMLGVKVQWDGPTNHVLLGNSYVDQQAVTPTPAPVTTGKKTFTTGVYMGEYQPVEVTITSVRQGAEALQLMQQYQNNLNLNVNSIEPGTEAVLLEYEVTIPSNLVEKAKFYTCNARSDIEDITIGNTRYYGITYERDMYGKNTHEITKTNKRYGVVIAVVPTGYKDWVITFDGNDVCPDASIKGSELY